MGAVVELFGSGTFRVLTALTDIHGRYRFSDLVPGHYSIQVQQSDSVSDHRQNIRLERNSHAIVNLTMVSLFDVSQWFPALPRGPDEPADEWKWALRSSVDRPVLRWLDATKAQSDREATRVGVASRSANPDIDGTEIPTTPARPVRVHAAVTSGSSQFGEGGVRQEAFIRMREGNGGEAVFHVQTSTSGAAFVAGGVERTPGLGDTARAAASFRTLPVNYGAGLARLQVFQIRGGEQLILSDALRAQFGAETEAVQAGQSEAAALPFMAVHLIQSGSEISYRLATASDLQGLTDLASTGGVPAMAIRDGKLRLTHSLHQELSINREMAGMKLEAAYFYDRMTDPILNGYGDEKAVAFAPGDVLLDPVTGAFRSSGPNYSGGGFRIVAARQVNGGVWAAIEYAEGPAIAMPTSALASGVSGSSFTDALASAATTRSESVLVSMHGSLPGADTKWKAGYRWQPEATITAVDPFNTGMSAPFFSVELRQPIGSTDSPLDRLALEFVMQNILAQGYRPIYLIAGQTLYLAQGPRLFTGGLAFSF